MKKNLIYIGVLMMLASCGANQQYTVSSVTGERVLVTPTDHPDIGMLELVSHYKAKLDREMNVVIGESDDYMPFGKPESLLTNFTSDVMMLLDTKYTEGTKPDLTVMNVNGHRAPMPEGDITVGDLFEVYSFDNELAVVKLKGSDLLDLFDSYAKMGGSGISSNVRLIISKDGKLIDAKVNGKPVDKDKIYTVVTLDYLAEGNDGMDAFKKSLSVYKPGIILRDYMIEYVKSQTEKDKDISSELDGRITVQ
ncbi:MAG: 5'-nucleotidase C-terminal domain-containing protein [Dysgonomonas sp.]